MALQRVIYEKDNHTIRITLNRPQAMNAIDSTMANELAQVWQDFKQDDDALVAILTGAGERAFCAGADMELLAPVAPGKKAAMYEWHRLTDAAFIPATHRIWKPIIVAVNGMCTGAGLHFVGDGDIIICSQNATFFDSHVNVGQIAAVEPISLSRRIPLGIILRMFLVGGSERINAERAYQIGLVSEVVPLLDLMTAAVKIADKIVQNSPSAVSRTKEAIWRGLDVGLWDALMQGHYQLQEIWGSWDQVEGPRAFAEKRKPTWKSRALR